METLVHILFFAFSSAVIWFFAGLLIESVDRIANRFNRGGFTIAFFLLGFLTSISEISVAINATINDVPQVSVGNLIGASFVILLLIIPLLAFLGGGVTLRHTLSKRNLQLALVTILLPVFFVIDGGVSVREGILAILVYVTLLFAIKGQKDSLRHDVKIIQKDLVSSDGNGLDMARVVTGAVFIFLAGHFLVEQAVYFANLLSVPSSLVGLILLSIGTNVPELVIAVRSILNKHKDIAFGDYIGSAATNTVIFGFLAVMNGGFGVESSEFVSTALLMLLGLWCFYFFARSKSDISSKEGLMLLAFYACFFLIQMLNIARLGSG